MISRRLPRSELKDGTHPTTIVLNPHGIFPPVYAELTRDCRDYGGWRDMAEAGAKLQGVGLAFGCRNGVRRQVFSRQDDDAG